LNCRRLGFNQRRSELFGLLLFLTRLDSATPLVEAQTAAGSAPVGELTYGGKEFNLYNSQLGFEQTGNLITKSINAYNQLRPHASCDYMAPEQTHLKSGQLNKRWKNYNKHHNYEKATV
jgi:hypothetical protein